MLNMKSLKVFFLPKVVYGAKLQPTLLIENDEEILKVWDSLTCSTIVRGKRMIRSFPHSVILSPCGSYKGGLPSLRDEILSWRTSLLIQGLNATTWEGKLLAYRSRDSPWRRTIDQFLEGLEAHIPDQVSFEGLQKKLDESLGFVSSTITRISDPSIIICTDASYSGSVESCFGGMIISDSTNEHKRGFRFNLRSLNVQNAFRAEATGI